MGVPRKASLRRKFDASDPEIRKSFEHYPTLFKDFPAEFSIAYLFTKLELAQNNTIYCGVVKLHKVNADLARVAIQKWHITRSGFKEKYKIIFGQCIGPEVVARLDYAEKIRDSIVHGKQPKDGAMRQAIYDILEYSEGLSATVKDHGRFTPFGSLRGFKGRAKSHDKSTSRWILKGMGFSL